MIGFLMGRRPMRLLALAPIALMACAAQAQLSGAIQTTFEDGTTVNGNIYPSKDKVFLNGGPQNQNAAGLMDGVYFFQVTNPNGHVLLSTTNAVDRLVKVTNGRFAGRCKLDGTLLQNPVSPHRNAAAVNPANGSLGVQLAPFLDTPNNGGEYKAWVMLRKLDGSSKIYAQPASDNIHVDFANRYAKTDNFKVKKPITPFQGFLAGLKFFDLNMNGQLDPQTEYPIQGFIIKIVLNGDTANPKYVTTDSSGTWKYGPIVNGTKYKISEVLPPDSPYQAPFSTKWIQTSPGTMNDATDDRGYEDTMNVQHDGDTIDGNDFGNTQIVTLSGIKFYDRNMNGTRDSGEDLLKNWPIKVKVDYPDGSTYSATLHTDSNGAYKVLGNTVGSGGVKGVTVNSNYTISEENKDGWIQTWPAGNLYAGTITPGQPPYTVAYNQPDVTGRDFGNILSAKIKGVKFLDKDMDGHLDSGESKLQGFTIHISGTKPDGTQYTDSAVTDANGAYEFGPYPDGTTYSITEDVPAGWQQTTPSPVTGTITASGTLDADSTLPDIVVNIGNIKTFDLSGVKFYDANMNGTKDGTEVTIPGFTIKIKGTRPDGSSINESTTTNSNGAYMFGPYPDGTTYSITETVPAGWLQTTSSPITGTLNGKDATDLNIGNILVAKLKGVKFYDANMNGSKDSGEATIPGFTIKITGKKPDGSSINDSKTTDSNGAFEFGPYPDGTTYSITETLPAGWKQTTSSPITGTLAATGPFDNTSTLPDVTGLNIGNILMGKIKGVKFLDANTNGQLDSGESTLQGFTIKITGTKPDGSPVSDSKVTGPNGEYEFGPYPDGTTYSITETVPAGWQQTTPSPVTGTISATPPITATSVISDVIVNVGNIKVFKISGVKFYDKNYNGAKDTGEALLAGFTIKITGKKPDGSSISDSTTTDSNGAYSFGPYPDGTTFSLTEDVPAGWKRTTPSPLTGTLSGADTTDQNFGNILMASIKGVKFYDYNMNKAKDGTEPVLAGFTVKISFTLPNGQTGNDSTVTGNDGAFSFGPYPDGTSYSITETVPSGWLQTTSSPATGTLSAGSTITINTVLADVTVNVGNIKLARLSGCKWYDTNGNGIKDSGEPGIQGFKIVISYTKPNGSTGTETIYTDSNGAWQSKLYPEGTTYTVKEVMPPTGNWKQTYPAAPGTYSGTIKGNTTPMDNTYTVPDVTGLKFGNRVCPIINAHTKGYWHNNNGYATMNDGGTIVPELTMLNNLPLVRLNGSAADFNTANPSAGFTDFSNWITNDSNGSNMACQLSAQLAAMELNVEAGFVSSSQLLYAPGTSSADSLGVATLSDLMNEAIAALIANPITVVSSPARTKQNAIMTALDKGNNNLNWLNLPIIIVVSPY